MISVYIFTEGKSIYAVKNENEELTHTQVFYDCIGATDTSTKCGKKFPHSPILL